MTFKADILARFNGEISSRPFYLPDLTLWYNWHNQNGTLPDVYKNTSLPYIARDMGVPLWMTARPWTVETPNINVTTTKHNQERIIRIETQTGILESRWTLGPDGAWWQIEYPIKTPTDLSVALELVTDRTYTVDAVRFSQLEKVVGDDGIVAIEIPRRPYSDLLHDFLGWGDGLMLLNEPIINDINDILEAKLQELIKEIAHLPGEIIFSPDNLDGQFIPPPVFEAYLANSYRQTVDVLHQQNKRLLVHIGGPIKHLLPLLAQANVDGLEGVAGLPQNNASLTEARELLGPGFTLWGGIPQDFLLDTHDDGEFEVAAQQAIFEIADDPRMLLGIADRIPVDVNFDRLQIIPQLIASTYPL